MSVEGALFMLAELCECEVEGCWCVEVIATGVSMGGYLDHWVEPALGTS